MTQTFKYLSFNYPSLDSKNGVWSVADFLRNKQVGNFNLNCD